MHEVCGRSAAKLLSGSLWQGGTLLEGYHPGYVRKLPTGGRRSHLSRLVRIQDWANVIIKSYSRAHSGIVSTSARIVSQRLP